MVKLPVKRLLYLALLATLSGCSGHGGGNNSSTPVATTPTTPTQPTSPTTQPIGSTTQTPVPKLRKLKFGYFGVSGNQITETAGHVTFIHIMDWGDWSTVTSRQAWSDNVITTLQQAKSLGITDAWLGIGYLCFNQQYKPNADFSELKAFKTQLDNLGLTSMVSVLYPVDEPESRGLNSGNLGPVIAAIKAIWPVKVAVIYGNTQSYPALSSYDLIGKDKYGDGAEVINEMPPISGSQQLFFVPGGADPWKNDPQPFYDRALSDPRIYAIMPFVWFDQAAGPLSGPGIRSNGMAPKYVAIGNAIKANQ